MPQRFFVDANAVAGGRVVVTGALAGHVARSLRMRRGDTITAVDSAGREHGVLLEVASPERVEGVVTWSRAATGEPALRVAVLQALPRERFEDCVDVLVEAGAAEIRPLVTERVVARPTEDRLTRRLERWQLVATEAAQLAGRGMIPRVHAPVELGEALAGLAAGTRLLACDLEAAASIAEVAPDPGRPLALCIGPEGGFSGPELALLAGAGAETVHLGARVLRTRYAGALACALLLGRSGDLDSAVAGPPS